MLRYAVVWHQGTERLQYELANAMLGGELSERSQITFNVQNGDFTLGRMSHHSDDE